MPMDPRHPGPHLMKEIRRRLAKLTHDGVDPVKLAARRPPTEAGAPPSTAELQATLAELDALLELNPPPGSAEMARLEELAGLVATYADAPSPPEEPEPKWERQG